MTRDIHEQVPPQSVDAERAVIGAILLEKSAAVQDSELLQAADFYLERHRLIFATAMELLADGAPLDLVMMGQRLRDRGQLEAAGGTLYLMESMAFVPSAFGLRNYATIVTAKALQRKLIALGHEVMQRAYDGRQGVDDLVSGLYRSLDEIAEDGRGKAEVRSAFDCVQLLADGLEEELRTGESSGITAPLAGMRDVLRPLRPGQVIFLAGRPGMGKSGLALQWAWHAAFTQHRRTLYFSLEMNHEEMGERLMKAVNGELDAERILQQAGKPAALVAPVRAAGRHFKDLPLEIVTPRGVITPGDVGLYSRLAKLRGGLDFLVIDYLGLMSPNERVTGDYEIMTALSKQVKALATQLEVPILAVHQLTRSSENRKPRIPTDAELRGSGQLEQDAHAVIILYRPGYYYAKDASWSENEAASQHLGRHIPSGDETSTLIKIDKQRRGPTGTCWAKFAAEQTWFTE